MSSDRQPEFFLLRNDAQSIADEDWIAEGCRRGWVLLTKDRRIRYRAQELAALQDGFLFCLSDGNASLDTISGTWVAAMPSITRAVERGMTGFWHVYVDGTIKLMWP
jgi:adenosylmethionine-8-amino-7-oxononanoate aminotransferase